MITRPHLKAKGIFRLLAAAKQQQNLQENDFARLWYHLKLGKTGGIGFPLFSYLIYRSVIFLKTSIMLRPSPSYCEGCHLSRCISFLSCLSLNYSLGS